MEDLVSLVAVVVMVYTPLAVTNLPTLALMVDKGLVLVLSRVPMTVIIQALLYLIVGGMIAITLLLLIQ